MARATDPKAQAVQEVRLIEAASGTARIHGRKLTVLRGTLMPQYFEVIKTPAYQRELMTTSKHDDLVAALGPDGIGVPDDLLLCCRTSDFTSVGAGELVIATDILYTLDGLQRIGAAKARLKNGWKTDPFGVKILLDTSEALERALFYQVNRLQTKVATHVHLRNAGDNAAIAALRELAAKTKGFPDVQWNQLRGSGDKITAHMLYEITIMLHGYPKDRPIEGILEALEGLTDRIGTERIADNVKTFFEVIRECFGETDVRQYLTRKDLLRGMALLFATYQNFWDKRNTDKLLVQRTDILKLKGTKWTAVAEALRLNNASTAISQLMARRIELGRSVPLQLREPY